MNKKLNIFLIAFLLTTNFAAADYYNGLSKPSDFTGDSIIGAPTQELGVTVAPKKDDHGTIPPIKKLRLKYKKKYKKFFTDGTTTPTEFLEPVTNEDDVEEKAAELEREEDSTEISAVDEVSADGKKKKKLKKISLKKEKSEDDEKNLSASKESVKLKDRVVMTCETMDYDTDNAVITARGNVEIALPEQGVVLYADDVVFDKVANTIKADSKVLIKRGDTEVTGDYIHIDLNEENILLARPISTVNQMEIIAEQANLTDGKIVQENGSILFKKSSPINFQSGRRGPRLQQMMVPKDDSFSKDLENGRYKIKATKMVIDSEKEHDVFYVQKAEVYKDGKKIFTLPRTKFYTNKNHDYMEGDFFEIAGKRGIGAYAGPGFAFKLPKGAALKAVPFVSYKSGFGVGGMLRFNSGTNETYLMYGSQDGKFVGKGRQELDDNLHIQYATNDYMDEWFLGRARPKYGISLVYDKQYANENFLGEDRNFTFRHRLSGGFYKDINTDKYYKALRGTGEETYRIKYMMQGAQTLWSMKNEEELKCVSFELLGQLSAAVYGTGDTQTVGRVGPRLHTQYKRWMQDLGYFQAAYQDDTPMPVYDSYRYGKSSVYLRETFRINKMLALSWFGTMNLSNDARNNKAFQECSFYASLGPDELKLNVGYDFVRANVYFTVGVALDPKGTEIKYDKLEIKNADKFGSKKDDSLKPDTPTVGKPKKAPILKRAIVEEMTV